VDEHHDSRPIDGAAAPVTVPTPATAVATSEDRPEAANADALATSDPVETEDGDAPSEDAGPDDGGLMEEESIIVVRRPWFITGCAVALLLIAGLAALNVYQWRHTGPSVATVNGKAISRGQYDKAVADDNGSQVLDSLISKTLVEQDAARRHVTVTPDEIDAKLKEAKSQFSTDAEYRQALDAQHINELQLRDGIRFTLLLQKLAQSNIQVSDAEVQQEYDQNKDTQYKGQTLDQVKDSITQQLTSQKQQDAASAYLAKLRSSAHIAKHIPGA
jgi:parvulin-like peptidyl-prolyl isomerase